MDLAAYAQQIRQCIQVLEAEAPAIVERMAQTGRVLAQQRVQEQGIAGAAYSQNLVPTFLFANRALNARGKQYIKKTPMGTWGGFRAAQGLPNTYVNLTYSGRMFQSLHVVRQGATGGVYRAAVVASDSESARKLRFNLERYGDFMKPTPQEQGEVTLVADRAIRGILKQYLG